MKKLILIESLPSDDNLCTKRLSIAHIAKCSICSPSFVSLSSLMLVNLQMSMFSFECNDILSLASWDPALFKLQTTASPFWSF